MEVEREGGREGERRERERQTDRERERERERNSLCSSLRHTFSNMVTFQYISWAKSLSRQTHILKPSRFQHVTGQSHYLDTHTFSNLVTFQYTYWAKSLFSPFNYACQVIVTTQRRRRIHASHMRRRIHACQVIVTTQRTLNRLYNNYNYI